MIIRIGLYSAVMNEIIYSIVIAVQDLLANNMCTRPYAVAGQVTALQLHGCICIHLNPLDRTRPSATYLSFSSTVAWFKESSVLVNVNTATAHCQIRKQRLDSICEITGVVFDTRSTRVLYIYAMAIGCR